MKHLFYVAVCAALILTACQGKKPDEGVRATEIAETYTDADDTLSALVAVDAFMQLVMTNQVDEAVEQLYLVPLDQWGKPDPLAIEDKERFRTTLGLFPIVGYDVDSMAFRRVYDNDVWVTMRIGMDGVDSGQRLQLHFCPVNYLSNWFLTLKDNVD